MHLHVYHYALALDGNGRQHCMCTSADNVEDCPAAPAEIPPLFSSSH